MFLENLSIAIKSILSNKMRSFLTTLGIMIGVCSIITVFGLVNGIFATFDQQIKDLGTDVIRIYPYVEFNSSNRFIRKYPELTFEDAKSLEQTVPYIGELSANIYSTAEIKSGDKTRGTQVFGSFPKFQDINAMYVEKGRFITNIDIEMRKRICVIGKEIHKQFNYGNDYLGKFILINKIPYKIVGMMESRGEIFGQSLDDFVIIPFSSALDLFGKERAKRIRVEFAVTDVTKIPKIKSTAESLLRKRHNLKKGDPNDFKIETQEELIDRYKTQANTTKYIVVGIVSIALLVAGIGIMNIMLVTVTERTKEIGIRKSLGATRKNILNQFLIEAVTLSFLGGLIGVLIGVGLSTFLASIIPKWPEASVPIGAIFLAFGFSAFIGIIFGVFPAAKASNLDPIEALRHE